MAIYYMGDPHFFHEVLFLQYELLDLVMMLQRYFPFTEV